MIPTKSNWRLALSTFIPVHFTTVAGRNPTTTLPEGVPTRISWWQWRHRVLSCTQRPVAFA